MAKNCPRHGNDGNLDQLTGICTTCGWSPKKPAKKRPKRRFKHVTARQLKALVRELNSGSELSRPTGRFVKARTNIKVWKKVLVLKPGWTSFYRRHVSKLIQLTIPKGTIIYVSSDFRKCRAAKAISHGDGISSWDQSFEYITGETVVPRQFSMRGGPCAGGIHFFIEKADTKNYYI